MLLTARQKAVLSFKEFKCIHVSQEEMQEHLKFYHENGIPARSKCIRKEWTKPLIYREEEYGNYIQLFCRSQRYELVCYSTNFVDSTKYINQDERKRTYAGRHAVDLVEEKFRIRTGKSLRVAFGFCNDEIQSCVPRSLMWTNSRYTFRTFSNVGKVDYSSNFPYNLCGKLPDAHTAIQRKGTVLPTKEYPFAFYLVSHHCAEYERFNTREWEKTEFWYTLSHDRQNNEKYEDISPDEDITILMKSSPEEITPEMQYFYNQKLQGDTEAKLVMNAFIGKLHPSVSTSRGAMIMYHIAAITIGRATTQIIKDYYEVLKNGCAPLMIQTDSIIYAGNKKFGVEKKSLGALVQEFYNVSFRMVASGQYAMQDNKTGEILSVKHQGIKDISMTNIQRLEDIDAWKDYELTYYDSGTKEFKKGKLFTGVLQ